MQFRLSPCSPSEKLRYQMGVRLAFDKISPEGGSLHFQKVVRKVHHKEVT